MQLMSVDGLTRENVASHLQKYRLYLKRMQGLSSGSGGGGGGGLSDAATDHLFASSPVPTHPGRPPIYDHFMLFVPVSALQHQHHQQAAADGGGCRNSSAAAGGQFDHPLLARPAAQQQAVLRMGPPVHNAAVPGYVEDLESANGNGGRKVLALFPTGDD
ncbi:unnamed protein product [Linum tenue]|uniref:Uncharacterized protein n=1 Tax=Linum tenue TaxID=586396 RepID=A0AAV0HZK8_9ROSI|nr:unnamed protein product [Linum tenue]